MSRLANRLMVGAAMLWLVLGQIELAEALVWQGRGTGMPDSQSESVDHFTTSTLGGIQVPSRMALSAQ
jgi:hypothetical protein